MGSNLNEHNVARRGPIITIAKMPIPDIVENNGIKDFNRNVINMIQSRKKLPEITDIGRER